VLKCLRSAALAAAFLLSAGAAQAATCAITITSITGLAGNWCVFNDASNNQFSGTGIYGIGADHQLDITAGGAAKVDGSAVTQPVVASVTNAGPTAPTSTLTLTTTTTAYTTGQLIANNGTAGSITVPSFAIANSAGAATIRSMVLTSNDSISTGWGGQTVQIDLWSAAPTFTNGDHAAYVVATGSAGYLGSFTCFFLPVAGDGAYANCAPLVQPEVGPIKLASGTSIFWTVESLSGTPGVVTLSKVFTLQPKVYN
jgi:hypothetical protein